MNLQLALFQLIAITSKSHIEQEDVPPTERSRRGIFGITPATRRPTPLFLSSSLNKFLQVLLYLEKTREKKKIGGGGNGRLQTSFRLFVANP